MKSGREEVEIIALGQRGRRRVVSARQLGGALGDQALPGRTGRGRARGPARAAARASAARLRRVAQGRQARHDPFRLGALLGPHRLVGRSVEALATDRELIVTFGGVPVAHHALLGPAEVSVCGEHYPAPPPTGMRSLRPRTATERAFLGPSSARPRAPSAGARRSCSRRSCARRSPPARRRTSLPPTEGRALTATRSRCEPPGVGGEFRGHPVGILVGP